MAIYFPSKLQICFATVNMLFFFQTNRLHRAERKIKFFVNSYRLYISVHKQYRNDRLLRKDYPCIYFVLLTLRIVVALSIYLRE